MIFDHLCNNGKRKKCIKQMAKMQKVEKLYTVIQDFLWASFFRGYGLFAFRNLLFLPFEGLVKKLHAVMQWYILKKDNVLSKNI